MKVVHSSSGLRGVRPSRTRRYNAHLASRTRRRGPLWRRRSRGLGWRLQTWLRRGGRSTLQRLPGGQARAQQRSLPPQPGVLLPVQIVLERSHLRGLRLPASQTSTGNRQLAGQPLMLRPVDGRVDGDSCLPSLTVQLLLPGRLRRLARRTA